MVGVQLFNALKWNTAGLQNWSSTLLRIPAISFSHSITIFQTNVSLQPLVLDLSAELGTLGPHAVWYTDYFSVSSYKELRWNKRTMQEKITSIVSVSVIILGVSVLCQYCVSVCEFMWLVLTVPTR